MAERTFEENVEYAPFNSRINQVTGEGDRTYNANQLARWLSSVNSDGVARKFEELEVVAASGMNVEVKTGVGFVDGRNMYLKSNLTVPLDAASSTGDRIDTVGYRLDTGNRKVVIYYKTGELGTNEPPEVTNNDSIIEIPLCNIYVAQGATSIADSDITDVRKFVVSSATYFKKYTQTYNTNQTTRTMLITVPFNSVTDDIEVYINGIMLAQDSQYQISGNTITFWRDILAGNEIQILVWHFADGSGSMDSLDKVMTELEELDKIKKYYYICNGGDDNEKLSQIAQDFLGGTGDFVGVNAYAQMEIIVCGDCGVARNYSGDGSQSRPYTYFAFGRATGVTRTVYFNFANCSRISVSCSTTSGTYSTIFSGADINIRNCNLNVTQGYNVDIFNGTNVHCQDSEFWMTTTNDCCVGKCCGTFENVRTSITSTGGNAFGFYGNGRLTKINGGTHYAWTAGRGKESVCAYVEAGQTENVLFVSMANFPQNARSGYSQTDTIKVNNGYATIMSNAMFKTATVYNVDNCIRYGNVIISKN